MITRGGGRSIQKVAEDDRWVIARGGEGRCVGWSAGVVLVRKPVRHPLRPSAWGGLSPNLIFTNIHKLPETPYFRKYDLVQGMPSFLVRGRLETLSEVAKMA
jgi:hypothetical protein